MTTISRERPVMKKTGESGLRKGYTTGACATAAAKAAAYALISEAGLNAVDVTLPTGDEVTFAVHTLEFNEDWAKATVIKDAGDDPDVTNRALIGAFVKFYTKGYGVVVDGGKGVGRVTKPGLPVPVGHAAINPVPLKMIKEELAAVLKETGCPLGLDVTIFVPDGETLAKKTLNERLGIIGGISILGTTGIVEPISTSAWTDTISMAMDVARACGVKQAVLTPGRTSEVAAMRLFSALPEEAFIQMGDHVGYALAEARRKGFSTVTVVGQFGKLVKIAMGAVKTHAADSTLELSSIAELAEAAGLDQFSVEQIAGANTARETFFIARDSGGKELFSVIMDKVRQTARGVLGSRVGFECVMVDYEGNRV